MNLFYEKDKFIFARVFHFSPIDMYIHIYINDKIYLFIFFFFIPRKIFSFVIRNQFLLTRTIAHLFFLQRTNKFSIRIREKKKKKNNNTQSSLHNPHKGGLIRNTSHARSLIPRVHISIYIYIRNCNTLITVFYSASPLYFFSFKVARGIKVRPVQKAYHPRLHRLVRATSTANIIQIEIAQRMEGRGEGE